MPLVQVKLIQGVFDATEKEATIQGDALVASFVQDAMIRPINNPTTKEIGHG